MTLAADLAEFTASHPVSSLRRHEGEVRYRVSGDGQPAIVLLTGALGIGHLGFQVHRALESRFRILAPDYPDTDQPARLLADLVAMLDAEGIGRAVIHGSSFGGLIAQRLVDRVPDRIAGLILSHTGLVATAGSPGWLLALVERLPKRWVVGSLTKRLRGLMRGADPAWLPLFDNGLARLGTEGLFRRLRLGAGLAKMPEPAGRWRGPALLIDSDDDPAVRPAARAALRRAFPDASQHTFHGTGHIAPVLDPIGYAEIVAAFAAGIAG
ncbi:MAG: alpha/beta fold hydrolase [Gemmatimonadales bacterium]